MAKPKNLVNVAVDTKRMTTLQTKLAKYPPVAIKAGLKAAEDYLNDDQFKMSMYPASQAGQPFEWTNDRQRRKVMALLNEQGGPPYQRTYELAQAGVFSINEGYLTVEYQNQAPYSKYVIHPSTMIVGHRKRGWTPINQFVVAKSREVAKVFEQAVKDAWARMESFMFGGGAGL